MLYIYIYFKMWLSEFPNRTQVSNFFWPTTIDSAPRLVSGTKYIFVEIKNGKYKLVMLKCSWKF